MKIFAFILVILCLSQPTLACDKEILKSELANYIQAHLSNYKKSIGSIYAFSDSLGSSYNFLEGMAVNKSRISTDSFSPLEEAEALLVESVDGLYDSQEILLEQLGEQAEEDNYYGRLLNCYPELSEQLIEKIELHISEVKLEESNISAIFDTLYNYSSKTLKIVEDLNLWLEENKTGDVPSAGQFSYILDFSSQALSGAECAKDLMNLTQQNMCQIAFVIGESLNICLKPLYPEVGHCK